MNQHESHIEIAAPRDLPCEPERVAALSVQKLYRRVNYGQGAPTMEEIAQAITDALQASYRDCETEFGAITREYQARCSRDARFTSMCGAWSWYQHATFELFYRYGLQSPLRHAVPRYGLGAMKSEHRVLEVANVE